jgi:nucleotide-binding universal stress UspA family protein
MRVLVVVPAGHDGSLLAGPAAQLARESGGTVMVLGVDDVESQRFEPIPRSELSELAEHSAQATAERLRAEGVTTEVTIRSGPAQKVAMDVAEELDADLIVVGAGSRGPMMGRLLGNLPMDLVRRSGRQVLVVADPPA